MVKLTSFDVSRLWWRMTMTHNAKVVDKSSSSLMSNVAGFLGAIGIVRQRDFMEKFSTTIGTTIYLPFTPGVESEQHDLVGQACTCVHELHHVAQFRRAPIGFTRDYLFNSSKRAAFEADAYAHNMELRHWITGARPDPANIAERLKAYACKPADIAFAQKYLETIVPVIMQGGLSRGLVKEAVAILSSGG